MIKLSNFRLTTRITAGFAVMVALVIAVGAVAIWAMRSSVDVHASPELRAWIDRMVWSVGAASAVAAAIGIVLGWAIRRSIKLPVERVVASVGRIAGGDLASKIESHGRDEIAWLNYELNQMRKQLQTTISNVRQSAEMVAQASSEIASGNNDLSVRTEQQAISLQRTSHSMDSLTNTVKHNADHAHEANRLAAKASDVAVKGGQVMNEVVTTMSEINGSASKIVDIIGVIDSIAFQTNILALNAAVEAARAGEQGRGFAVVATEVRGLAQRSAAAAKEIKALISQSVTKVETGVRLVDVAGSTMDEILKSVEQVTHIMGEISTASADQRAGIEQVHEAIAQIDSVTQQNAALVEQASAAAGSLQEQSQTLANAVKIFNVVKR
ncbi:methyl-accepting chemotaxis protein [Paraburkholderia terricola]|uniref:Methyl-accepting chemotaxis protein n=1 Tax=Paraburkholderia terricola TaxID=169427 RepID=A0ABU1LYD1_9BURK|nr:methyl-accepting chemotaxis protein [Paraburkholderia terricola]AXE92765.1 methyl-accepting chemotaxis protein [Paraburkholderia terricola]MDR6411581.1 methyl-accepting chemotaxis protein [Paraburkholderia terricola]MDR6483744.1 methyl-accepting chemotaxis protein [Paraburkholderia terricola]